MNSLKPVGGWMGTLGEGELNTVGRAELMACVVAAESTRGNVVYVTDYQILKKRQDRGWPTPRLGQGSNPDLWWRLSRALKTRQGTFKVQWQRAHVDVADIKTENHDMAIVFGNEMADAVAKKAAGEAALRGAAAEQVAWVDALAWQVQRRIVEANLQASKANPTVLTLREKGLRRVQYKTVLQALFQRTTHQLAFRRSRQRWECQTCKQIMGRNVACALVKGRPMFRRDPDHAEYWEFAGYGCAAGAGGGNTFQLGGKSCIRRIQWPNIEVLRGAGIVRHGHLDPCAS